MSAKLNKIISLFEQVYQGSGGAAKLIYNRILGDKENAKAVISFAESATKTSSVSQSTIDKSANRPKLKPPTDDNYDIRLFSWKLSYFSGKIRSYLRYKSRCDGLRFEDINASPSIISNLLIPLTDSNTVPQIQLPNGEFIQDSSQIIDQVEKLFPKTSILPNLKTNPKQRMICRILELFGDEWLLVAAYHWRWAYSTDSSKKQWMYSRDRFNKTKYQNSFSNYNYLKPSHLKFNKWQWGNFLRGSNIDGETQIKAGSLLFDTILMTVGPKMGCVHLGITSDEMANAFEESTLHFLSLFEQHLSTTKWNFILGNRLSLADLGLIGPLYAHLYEDPVPSFLMKTRFPIVSEWVNRVHNRGGKINRQTNVIYDKKTSSLINIDKYDINWPQNDYIPDTLIKMIQVFFMEMWPVLIDASTVLTKYINGKDGLSVPHKSFGACGTDQINNGPLVHGFKIPIYDILPGTFGENTIYSNEIPKQYLKSKRMVVPYQFWMLGRIADELEEIK
eukprot:3715_1